MARRHVGFAAPRLGNGAARAHKRCEEVFQFRVARRARTDAHALPARRRIEVEPVFGRELAQRIAVGIVDPMRAEIERHAKKLCVGGAASADPFAGLVQTKAAPGGGDAARCRDAGGPSADDDHVDLGAVGRGQRGRSQRRGGRGQE